MSIDIEQAVVYIEAHGEANGKPRVNAGGGVLIKCENSQGITCNVVVTCLHVVMLQKDPEILASDIRVWKANSAYSKNKRGDNYIKAAIHPARIQPEEIISAAGDALDVIVLELPHTGLLGIDSSIENINPRTSVSICGYPLGKDKIVSLNDGLVKPTVLQGSVDTTPHSIYSILNNQATAGGISGGAIFSKNALIGIWRGIWKPDGTDYSQGIVIGYPWIRLICEKADYYLKHLPQAQISAGTDQSSPSQVNDSIDERKFPLINPNSCPTKRGIMPIRKIQDDCGLFSPLVTRKYKNVMIQLKAAHQNLWEIPQHFHYIKYGPEHARSVYHYLDTCFGRYFRLDEMESFILEAAIYLHDIGMQCRSVNLLKQIAGITRKSCYGYEDLDKIRRVHQILSRKMVQQLIDPEETERWCEIETSEVVEELFAVSLMCEGHTLAASDISVHLPNISSQYTALPKSINLLLLLYLLCIGDAMDATSIRVHTSHTEKMWDNLEPIDKYHCWKHWFVSNISFQGAAHVVFNYNIPETIFGWCDVISTCAESSLRKKLEQFGDQLNDWDVPNLSIQSNFCKGDAQTPRLSKYTCNLMDFAKQAQTLNPNKFSSSTLLDDPRKIYVPLRCIVETPGGNGQCTELIEQVLRTLPLGKIPVIFGACGEGKTFFARRLEYEMRIHSSTSPRLDPVLIHLKAFRTERRHHTSVFDRIRAALRRTDQRQDTDRHQLASTLEQGGKLFIFDGLDEVPFVNRKGAVEDVLERRSAHSTREADSAFLHNIFVQAGDC